MEVDEVQNESVFGIQIAHLTECKDLKELKKLWKEIKTNENIKKLIHSPGVMRFLYKCIRGKFMYFGYIKGIRNINY